MQIVSFKLDAEDLYRLRVRAKAEHRTVSAHLRKLIADSIYREGEYHAREDNRVCQATVQRADNG